MGSVHYKADNRIRAHKHRNYTVIEKRAKSIMVTLDKTILEEIGLQKKKRSKFEYRFIEQETGGHVILKLTFIMNLGVSLHSNFPVTAYNSDCCHPYVKLLRAPHSSQTPDADFRVSD